MCVFVYIQRLRTELMSRERSLTDLRLHMDAQRVSLSQQPQKL